MKKIKKSSFLAAWWLPNPHLQTIWPALFRCANVPVLRSERFTLSDGDFLDLVHLDGRQKPGLLVLLLHGLEGSKDSHYVKGMLSVLAEKGYAAVLMHFRGCSGEVNKRARGYHSGETGDLTQVIAHLQRSEPDRPIVAIGYSLGGNVLLKYVGETGANSRLHAAAAVSVPMRLDKAADRLQRGASRFYQWRLLRQLRTYYKAKFRNRDDAPFAIERVEELDDFWKFDNEVTAPLHGFYDVHDYYNNSSSRQYLRGITIPTLILQSRDDPFMSADIIPAEDELSDSVVMELSDKGGHVGFVRGNIPGKAVYWLEERLLKFLSDQDSL